MIRLLFVLLCVPIIVVAQDFDKASSIRYKTEFENAYSEYPEIPSGMLEAISFTNTRIRHIFPEQESLSCIGMPLYYGVMGLIEDGKDYFRNNLSTVSEISGISPAEIKSSPQNSILAFAAAYSSLMQENNISKENLESHAKIVAALSEIPSSGLDLGNDFALNSHVYSVFSFLNKKKYQELFELPRYNIDLTQIFGENNLKVLSSPKITFDETSVFSEEGTTYELRDISVTCPDYPVSHCFWVASPHFSSRAGTAITAIAMHTVQGSYAGCISWFQNPSSQVSTQYVVRSSDGQLTQMVLEADKAWHVAAENPYCIGYEHEGWVDDPAWYTTAMYQSSADLTRDICNRQNIDPLRVFYRDTLDDGTALDYGIHSLGGDGSCIKIKGHQHFPNNSHTDPGPNWTWDYYFKLINENPAVTTLTASSGSFFDTGGSGSNYGDDERLLWLIQPPQAENITITFSSWAMETNYDFMYIYDGDNEFAPLIGRFNTVSPGTITSSGGSLLIEFRSDCATTAAGWAATYSSTAADVEAPVTSVQVSGLWQTQDFSASFTDTDNNAVARSFYQVLDWDGYEWRANGNHGFFNDNFTTSLHSDWTSQVGTWSINAGRLNQSDEAEGNTNLHIPLIQTSGETYLYHFSMKLSGSGTNRRAGLHFFCDDPTLVQRGNSYMVYFRTDQNKCQIYKSVNDVIDIYTDDDVTVNADTWYDYKITINTSTGNIRAYQNNILVSQWTDPTPFTTGNYLSLRTGNCVAEYDDLKVYRQRGSSEVVTVGYPNGMIRYQNPDPVTPAARIKSIVEDANGNWSSLEGTETNIDWTEPDIPISMAYVNDGPYITDMDESTSLTTLSANWNQWTDDQSDIAAYYYAIGTTSGGTDVLNWTNNGLGMAMDETGLSLSLGTTYYVSVRIDNNAGLSSYTYSDGLTIVQDIQMPVAGFTNSNSSNICDGSAVSFSNASANSEAVIWTFENGNPAQSTDETVDVVFPSGTHNVTLVASNSAGSDTLIQTVNVSVIPLPQAGFSALETNLEIPSTTAFFTNSSTNATSFLWNFGDGITSADQAPYHVYSDTGFYSVSLIAFSSSCGNDTLTLVDYIHVTDPTGIYTTGLNSFHVFPNPFNQYIVVEVNEGKRSKIEFHDAAGRKMYESVITEKTHQISTEDFPDGFYWIRLTGNEEVHTIPLIKVRQ